MEPGMGCEKCFCNGWRVHGLISLSKSFAYLYGAYCTCCRSCSERIKKRQFIEPLIQFMNRQSLKNILLALVLFVSLCSFAKDKPKILVFSRTTGYHHSAIPDGISAIQLL